MSRGATQSEVARCTGDRSISLPVVDGGAKTTIRPSRSGPWRAAVLITIQVLMIGHIALYFLSKRYGWWGGITTTPIEPSESMEFVKYGIVNAGLIMFALALLATLVLGRWFCGWGCHLVLLQDACGWLMKKVGVRPKPFRSRLLIYVPLILAVYMFLWPGFYRVAVYPLAQRSEFVTRKLRPFLEVDRPISTWEVSWHMTTDDFWKTFPGWAVSVPFLFICGVATVYFLGAKGFCTYGCPYGGFFAPLDKVASGRIRVTDACEHCGHCTAVCTSNVRVHEEVREYGMVVDPGCMKCMDCVSVCPNDALYFGFGRPSIVKGAPVTAKPKRKYDLTWPEEIGMAAVFAGSFFAVRGVYGMVPMLMAAGTAGCVTFIAWKLWRLLRDPNANLYRYRLKISGRISSSGYGYLAFAVLTLLLVAHSGFMRITYASAQRHDEEVTMPLNAALAGQPMPPEMAAHAEAAARAYRRASTISQGGLALIGGWQSEIDMRLAWLQLVGGDLESAEQTLRDGMERHGRPERFCTNLMLVLNAQRRLDEGLDMAESVLLEQAEYEKLLSDFVQAASQSGRIDRAEALCRSRLERFPDNVPTLHWLALLRLESGDMDGGIAYLERVVELAPENPAYLQTMALALQQAGRFDEAEEYFRRAQAVREQTPGHGHR